MHTWLLPPSSQKRLYASTYYFFLSFLFKLRCKNTPGRDVQYRFYFCSLPYHSRFQVVVLLHFVYVWPCILCCVRSSEVPREGFPIRWSFSLFACRYYFFFGHSKGSSSRLFGFYYPTVQLLSASVFVKSFVRTLFFRHRLRLPSRICFYGIGMLLRLPHSDTRKGEPRRRKTERWFTESKRQTKWC